MSVQTPFLSIIIPAHNEESRLPGTLDKTVSFLEAQPYESELLVVENGSKDRTAEIVQAFKVTAPNVRLELLREKGKGKGLAVRTGMLAATGQFRFMCDADLSMPVSEISRFFPPHLDGYDIVIASREAQGAVRYDEPVYRHWGGRLVNLAIRLMALPGLRDTQCGFKCFRSEIAQDLFYHQTMVGFSFDVEILYIARLRGYRVIELPVPWYFNAESKVSPVRDTLGMVSDILKIRQNARNGVYNLGVNPGQ